MGFVGQLLGVKVRGAEGLHEKIVQVTKTAKSLYAHMQQEEFLEMQLPPAEKRGNAAEIRHIQQQIIKVGEAALKELEHLYVELFALTNEQREDLLKEIAVTRRLMNEGLNTQEDQKVLQALTQMEHKVPELLRATRMTAGFER
jgi:hypothetical protein